MAVIDPKGLLEMGNPSIGKKYEALVKILYLRGKPDLEGTILSRAFDSLILRCFGKLLSAGTPAKDVEKEYSRLTNNLKRIGMIARRIRFLGPLGRWLIRTNFRTMANLSVRQKVYNLNMEGLDDEAILVKAAKRYLSITDLFNFQMEICQVNDTMIEFRFVECPIGYVKGDDPKICMATNKWDRQCVRKMGARMLMKELIPEGASSCLGYIVPEGQRVPVEWRRYPRFMI